MERCLVYSENIREDCLSRILGIKETADEDSIQIKQGLEVHGIVCEMFPNCNEKLLKMLYKEVNGISYLF